MPNNINSHLRSIIEEVSVITLGVDLLDFALEDISSDSEEAALALSVLRDALARIIPLVRDEAALAFFQAQNRAATNDSACHLDGMII